MPNRALLRIAAGVWIAAIASAADVPRPSPDFPINMVDGPQIKLSQYKGKVCVLAFILTTCPHCQKTVGYLSAIQNEYGPRGVQVLASAIDDMGKLNVPDFIKNFHPAFPVGFDTQDDVDGYLQQPVIYRMYVPQLVFIDRQGIIRAQHGGDDPFLAGDQNAHIREEIDTLLKEPAPRKKSAAAASTPAKKGS